MKKGARVRSRLGGAALLFAVAMSVASCSSQTQGSEKLQVVSGAAHLDESTETITTPIDAYGMSVLEGRIIDYANNLEEQKCMKGRGLAFPVVKPFTSYDDAPGGDVEDGGSPDRKYGVWNVESAARYGFDLAPVSPRLKELQALNSAKVSPTVQSAQDACFEYVVKHVGVATIKLYGESGNTITYRARQHPAAALTPSGHKAYQAWGDCLRDHSLKAGTENRFQPAGVASMSKEQQINAAIIDATCKQKTGLIQRLSDIDAAYEQQFIDANEAALNTRRKAIEAMVAKSKKIISEDAG